MEQSLQVKRNYNIFDNKTKAVKHLDDITPTLKDGEIVLCRYKDNGKIKTLIGTSCSGATLTLFDSISGVGNGLSKTIGDIVEIKLSDKDSETNYLTIDNDNKGLKVTNINANDVITEEITVIGTPLAQIINPNNSLDITLNQSNLQSVLKVLLEQELYPGNVIFTEGTVAPITSKPSISGNVNNGAYVEVGTKVTFTQISAPTITYSTTDRKLSNIDYGYSLSNNNTKEYDENEIIKSATATKINDGIYKLTSTYSGYANATNQVSSSTTQTNTYLSSQTVTVNEGSNKITVNYEAPKVSATFTEIPTIYFCSNLQKTSDEHKENVHAAFTVSATTLSLSSASHTVNGAWYLYMGGVNGTFTSSSQNVRNVGRKDMMAKGTKTYASTVGCDNVVIAFPSSWGILKQVQDNGSNTFITGNFGNATTITFKGAHEHGTNTYKVYVYSPDNRLNNGFNYTITIG